MNHLGGRSFVIGFLCCRSYALIKIVILCCTISMRIYKMIDQIQLDSNSHKYDNSTFVFSFEHNSVLWTPHTFEQKKVQVHINSIKFISVIVFFQHSIWISSIAIYNTEASKFPKTLLYDCCTS